MKCFVLEERINKFEALNKQERIEMIWMWCIQGVITLSQFKKLISFNSNSLLVIVDKKKIR